MELNNKKFTIYQIFLLFVIIVFSRNTLISSTLTGFNVSFFIIIIAALPLCKYFYDYVKTHNIFKEDKLFFIFLGSILLSILVKMDIQLYNLSVISYLVIGYMYVKVNDRDSIIKWFTIIISALACYSLACIYLFKPIFVASESLFQIDKAWFVIENSVGFPFYNMLLAFPGYFDYYFRNFGIFTEPGIYQFYLLIALIFVLFGKKLNKYFRLVTAIILLISLVTTASAAAYIVTILAVCTWVLCLLIEHKNRRKVILKRAAIGLVILLILVLIGYLYNDNIREMINLSIAKVTTSNDSINARLSGVFHSFESFTKAPIFGHPLNNVLNGDTQVIDTNMSIFAIYGVITGVMFILLQYKFVKSCTNFKTIQLLLLIVICLSCNNHFFLGAQSFWVLILLGLKKREVVFNENTMDC